MHRKQFPSEGLMFVKPVKVLDLNLVLLLPLVGAVVVKDFRLLDRVHS